MSWGFIYPGPAAPAPGTTPGTAVIPPYQPPLALPGYVRKVPMTPVPAGLFPPSNLPPSNPNTLVINGLAKQIGEAMEAILNPEPPLPNFFDTLKNKLKTRFPQPIPEDLEVFHMKCGGRVKPVWTYPFDSSATDPNRAQCEKATYESPKKIGGCGGSWSEAMVNMATDKDLRQWFYPRDEAQYVLNEQNKPVDEYGNKQPRAYYFLKKKEEDAP